jgi:outer membrane protein assembly factor BamB
VTSRRLVVAALAALLVLLVPAAALAGYAVPLAPSSPWPKFRRDNVQDGRSPLRPSMTGGALWTVRTGGGIFASPIIGADGTVYVGSADRNFWAISASGRVMWRFRTGEIIDSSGLLDNRGRVYVPSGDGHIYALNARTGALIWRFAALPPSATGAFINWFEGNIAIGPNGTLDAPNDGFRTYAINRDTGQALWALPTRDQTWSLPAVDAPTGRLYIGNNFFLGGAPNVFALSPAGSPEWSAQVLGSVVSSPLLTSNRLVVVGGFDGYVHAYDRATGAQRWSFATRDHIYSSAAQLSDGTIVIASTDGTIYGLDPATGRERWHYDTLNPIRSSPAVDGDDDTHIGTGDGRILVLNRNGKRLWALRVTSDPRATLNASPALGSRVIVAADSHGSIFSVPSDFCLRPGQRRNPNCVPRAQEPGRPRAQQFSRTRVRAKTRCRWRFTVLLS